MIVDPKGSLFIVSAPSGAGKSTLLSRLTENDARISYSISHTTRQPRAGELDEHHYYFVDEPEFRDLVARDIFHEWAEVHGNFYGTSQQPVEEQLARGLDVLLEIDVAGAASVREKMPMAISIFIMPPSCDILHDRLQSRGKDSEEVIQRRMKNAMDEMVRYHEYDYVLVNDDLDTCYEQLVSIIRSGRRRTGVNCQQIGKILATFGINSYN